jgi:hypothetical protein
MFTAAPAIIVFTICVAPSQLLWQYCVSLQQELHYFDVTTSHSADAGIASGRNECRKKRDWRLSTHEPVQM